jgi:hypothetical protein
MYSSAVRGKAIALMERGVSLRSISMSTGVNRATLRDWREHPEKALNRARCPRCADRPCLPEPHADYAYLLGLYLGDGCISRAGARDKEVWKQRIMCADAWPGLIGECERAMQSIRPSNKVSTQQKVGCTEVICCSRHWPGLFPQHGPGMKHMRKIELEPWQRTIVTRNPGHFARGLFHSDGYRGISRVRTHLADGDRWYEYPRTFCGCAGKRSIGWGWRGGSRGRTPFRWLGGRRWRGWTNSSGPSTEGSGLIQVRGTGSGRR